MRKTPSVKLLVSLLTVALPGICSTGVYAAKPIDLSKQNISILQSALSPTSKGISAINYAEISRSTDAKGTLHTRIQETYQGHPVWGADAIVHMPNSSGSTNNVVGLIRSAKGDASMDGIMYQDLTQDLAKTPAYVFSQAQADAAMKQALALFDKQYGMHPNIQDKQNELMVYVDKENKAHFAFKISFFAEPINEEQSPVNPIYILDATSFQTYENWNNLQNAKEQAKAGGYGGNPKIGRLSYDGAQQNLSDLSITRDSASKECFLNNNAVTIKNYKTKKIIQFNCAAQDPQHANLYWDGDQDAVNGGYSPANDALFGGAKVIDLYQQWYGIPVLTQNGKPMMLSMYVHKRLDNAYWYKGVMTFGDGIKYFYPLTTLDVAAHEVSHGFTEQHANLLNMKQSGGMNEAFSDMAAKAAEFLVHGTTSWKMGENLFKSMNRPLRYMDDPTKDCGNTGKAGIDCSIKHVSQYVEGDIFRGIEGTDVHFSAGIFNRAFYLLANSEGWGIRKAFDVMVAANRYYWTSQSTFFRGACGVMKATKQLGYDTAAVKVAFADVGINTDKC